MQTKPFDLGQVYSTGEAIKAQRIQNQQAPIRNAMLQQQLDNARQSYNFAQNQENRAQTEFGQKQTEFDNKQQIENTKLLHMAMTEIASNPDAAQRYIPMLSERGIMDGSKLDFTVMTPEALQAGAREVAESTGQALRALNTAQFKSSEMTSNQKNLKTISEIRQRIAAGDPNAQQELDDFMTTIRAPYSWQNTGSQFQAAPNMPGVTTPAPIVRDLPPEKTPPAIRAAERAKAEGQADAESSSPANIQAKQMKQAEAFSVINDIDTMLADREDGQPFLSYAYGRENRLVPEMGKPQTWIDAEAIRDRIIANLQLQNVQKLKGTGPITENEQKILKAAATVLGNELISPQLVKKELKRVRLLFKKWAKDNETIGYTPPTIEQPEIDLSELPLEELLRMREEAQ